MYNVTQIDNQRVKPQAPTSTRQFQKPLKSTNYQKIQ